MCWLASVLRILVQFKHGVPLERECPFLSFVPPCGVYSSERIYLTLCLRVEGAVGLMLRLFVVTDAPVLVRFPCFYWATSPASQNIVKTKTQTKNNRRNGQRRYRLITGGTHSDCKVRLAYIKEENRPRRKAPPPMWAGPIPVRMV